MKALFIVANWKSYKTLNEAKDWIDKISNLKSQISNLNEKTIILCPSFTLLGTVREEIEKKNLPLKLGVQNISPFDEGAYTGEINAKQAREFADYALIGHSERRENFSESDSSLSSKISLSKKYSLNPIFLVQGKETLVPGGVEIAAYEPTFAIGSGNPDNPTNANDVAGYLKKEKGVKFVLYGGSVTSDNVKSFTAMENIDGVLVGASSLDPQEFLQIINNA